ncbi:MAG: hypothetical protein WDN28_31450 [Chthoniobacter sp.]
MLDVTGKLTLGGTLELDFLNGFLPQTGDTFHLLQFGTLVGLFDQVTINGLASGWQFTLAPNGSTFDLISESNAQPGGVVPPPTDFLVPVGAECRGQQQQPGRDDAEDHLPGRHFRSRGQPRPRQPGEPAARRHFSR